MVGCDGFKPTARVDGYEGVEDRYPSSSGSEAYNKGLWWDLQRGCRSYRPPVAISFPGTHSQAFGESSVLGLQDFGRIHRVLGPCRRLQSTTNIRLWFEYPNTRPCSLRDLRVPTASSLAVADYETPIQVSMLQPEHRHILEYRTNDQVSRTPPRAPPRAAGAVAPWRAPRPD